MRRATSAHGAPPASFRRRGTDNRHRAPGGVSALREVFPVRAFPMGAFRIRAFHVRVQQGRHASLVPGARLHGARRRQERFLQLHRVLLDNQGQRHPRLRCRHLRQLRGTGKDLIRRHLEHPRELRSAPAIPKRLPVEQRGDRLPVDQLAHQVPHGQPKI